MIIIIKIKIMIISPVLIPYIDHHPDRMTHTRLMTLLEVSPFYGRPYHARVQTRFHSPYPPCPSIRSSSRILNPTTQPPTHPSTTTNNNNNIIIIIIITLP